jgi:transcriptional regulator with XRE-family HTH domain
LAQANLTLRIHLIIRERGLTQKEAAALLGVKQPPVSLLMRNRSVGATSKEDGALSVRRPLSGRPERLAGIANNNA